MSLMFVLSHGSSCFVGNHTYRHHHGWQWPLAKKAAFATRAGHARGVKRVRDIVEFCIARNIAYLTLFAFAPKLETSGGRSQPSDGLVYDRAGKAR